MKILIILLPLLLTNCFGPTIFNIGNYNITLSDIISSPNKVEYFKFEKVDDNKEDFENKKL